MTERPGVITMKGNPLTLVGNEVTEGLNSETDTDLLNIRDEVIAEINRTKYLLKLK